MLGTTVIPDCYRAWLPLKAALKLRLFEVLKKHLEYSIALMLGELDDPSGEDAVYKQQLAPANRMGAHHRMFGARVCFALFFRPS